MLACENLHELSGLHVGVNGNLFFGLDILSLLVQMYFRAFEVHSFARLEFIMHTVASVLRPARRPLLLKAPPTPATVRITMRSNPSPQRVPHTAVGQLRLTK